MSFASARLTFLATTTVVVLLLVAGCTTSPMLPSPRSSKSGAVPTTEGATPAEEVSPAVAATYPAFEPPIVRSGTTPVIGTVTGDASTSDGYRMHFVLKIHSAVQLSSIMEQTGSCGRVLQGWDVTTAGAIPVDLAVTDVTRGGFHVPAGDVVKLGSVFASGGVQVEVVGNSTTAFTPSLCEGFGAAPATTAVGYIFVDDFRSPNYPNGRYSIVAGRVFLQTQNWANADPLATLIPMSITSCRTAGRVHGRTYVDPLTVNQLIATKPMDDCALTMS